MLKWGKCSTRNIGSCRGSFKTTQRWHALVFVMHQKCDNENVQQRFENTLQERSHSKCFNKTLLNFVNLPKRCVYFIEAKLIIWNFFFFSINHILPFKMYLVKTKTCWLLRQGSGWRESQQIWWHRVISQNHSSLILKIIIQISLQLSI